MTDRPSKSARKREAQAIRSLADRLVTLKPDELTRVVADTDIVAAVNDAREMPSHGAGRRQRQYIAKLLRQIDITDIEQALAQADATPAEARRRFHTAERLRDQLLAGNDVDDTLGAARIDDAGPIREAVRQWQRARTDANRKKAAREVFRQLHAALESRDGAA